MKEILINSTGKIQLFFIAVMILLSFLQFNPRIFGIYFLVLSTYFFILFFYRFGMTRGGNVAVSPNESTRLRRIAVFLASVLTFLFGITMSMFPIE